MKVTGAHWSLNTDAVFSTNLDDGNLKTLKTAGDLLVSKQSQGGALRSSMQMEGHDKVFQKDIGFSNKVEKKGKAWYAIARCD